MVLRPRSRNWLLADQDKRLDIENTVYASDVDLYEFMKIACSLTNAPATFQCLVEKGFIGSKC